MSREIKFRAWDGKQMLTEENFDFVVSDYGSIINLNEYGWTEHGVDCVEQYTGLKDKNGIEIYEGDILGGMFEGCYIGWCDTTKSFELFNCYEHYCMACDGDILWCELSDSDIDLEVIGNIHENPELLENKE